jgi:hypothetical protein
VILALLAFVGVSVAWFQFGIAPRLLALTPWSDLLDNTFGYTPRQVYQALGAYGGEGRNLYVAFLLIDLLYAVLSAAALSLALAYIARRLLLPANPWQRVALLPIATSLGDLLENGCLLALTLAYPTRLDPLASLASLITTVKLALVYVSFSLVLFGFVALAITVLTRLLQARQVGQQR